MTTDRPASTMISVAALRALCGAGPGEIEALIRARLITVDKGQVSLVAGVRAYLESIRATAKSASLVAAQDAARLARAEAAELALAVDSRRLVREADAAEAVAAVCGAVMSAMSAIAARASRNIPERREIEAALRDAQGAVAAAIGAADVEADLSPTPAQPAKRSTSK